jgi:cytoskeleton protein RodZ
MTDSDLTTPTTTAGDLLRNYRLDQKVSLIDLANVLRVSVTKLEALENNAWDQLHDAMFVRSLSLAVCRQLQTDAAPILALLPQHDHSKLGAHNEKGLNSPLSRPSLLPQSTFDNLNVFFTPMRWAALGLFVLALCLAVWPEVQHWIVFKDNPEATGVVVPVVLPADPSEGREVTMVVTPVQSAAIPASAVAPQAGTSQMPASDIVTNLPLTVPAGVTHGR